MVKLACSILALLLAPAVCRTSEVLVERTTTTRRRADDAERRPGQLELESRYTIDSRQQAYRICYRRYLDSGLGARPPQPTSGAVEIMSGIGLERPLESGWYWRGFFNVLIDGVSLGSCRPEERLVVDGPRRGAAFRWSMPKASVDVTFGMLPMQDGLHLDISVDPKAALERDIEVQLIGFPCGFHRDGVRTLTTAVAVYRGNNDARGRHEAPDVETEWWWLFGDDVYREAARNRGACAVLFPPGEPRKADVLLGEYSVTASLFYVPGTKAIRLCLLEYPGLGAARALSAFRKYVSRFPAGWQTAQ